MIMSETILCTKTHEYISENEDKKLVKTLTSGNLYGHKIKDKFKLFVF